jgi:hypothetical protein
VRGGRASSRHIDTAASQVRAFASAQRESLRNLDVEVGDGGHGYGVGSLICPRSPRTALLGLV